MHFTNLLLTGLGSLSLAAASMLGGGMNHQVIDLDVNGNTQHFELAEFTDGETRVIDLEDGKEITVRREGDRLFVEMDDMSFGEGGEQVMVHKIIEESSMDADGNKFMFITSDGDTHHGSMDKGFKFITGDGPAGETVMIMGENSVHNYGLSDFEDGETKYLEIDGADVELTRRGEVIDVEVDNQLVEGDRFKGSGLEVLKLSGLHGQGLHRKGLDIDGDHKMIMIEAHGEHSALPQDAVKIMKQVEIEADENGERHEVILDIEFDGQSHELRLSDFAEGESRDFSSSEHDVVATRVGNDFTLTIDGEEMAGGHQVMMSTHGGDTDVRVLHFGDADAKAIFVGDDGQVIEISEDATWVDGEHKVITIEVESKD